MSIYRNQDMTMVVLEGALAVWTQEGGYASPSVSVGNNDLTTEIEDMVKQLELEPGHEGKFRITIKRIE